MTAPIYKNYTHFTPRTPSAASSTKRCKSKIKVGPDGISRPGLLSLSIFKTQSYITDFLAIERIFFGRGRPAAPIFRPVRSAPRSRMGHGLGQCKMAKINRFEKCSKAKKSRADHAHLHGCGGDYRTRICDLLRVKHIFTIFVAV